ncbi:ABC transporter permease [Tellurirhabdus rosea]|uniref:ABC transporter permease n=1 Tax=Tellurirhabdus rosea TaxID=2674997 RepID=UPI00224DBA30|nr:ABC transporter permease [Tellurirhabdus rosea]
MLQNYFKIAWRNLLRRKLYSGLNIVGLAVGITFALLISTYLWGEFGVNRQLRHADRQCLIQSRWKEDSRAMPITSLAPMAAALKTEYPALVANYYRFHGVGATLSKGSNHFRESIQIGDSTLLTMYGFGLLHGDPRTALNAPNAIVLTAAKAEKLFGTTDVLHQTLTVETPQAGRQEFQVTAVLKALTPNSVSHLLREPNEIFMSPGALPYFGADMNSWQNPYIVNYIELQPGVTPQDLARPLAQLIKTNAPADIQQSLTAYVTPLTDFYLESNFGLVRRLMTTLAVVAVFILLMAVLNFVNISMGVSTARLREIGVRKLLGGLRRQLTVQFLTEALVLTTLAFLLSIGLYMAFRPFFSEVVGKPIPALTELPWQYGALIPVGVLLIGGLAGAYPALHLAAYSTVASLKGKSRTAREGMIFRRALVTLQFSIAVFVFVGAIIVSRQIAHFFHSDLGFDKEAVLTVSSLPRNWSAEGVTRMQAARDQLARTSGVQAASLSFEIPNGNVGNDVSVYPEGRDSTRAVSARLMTTDEHYARTYGIELRNGRYFHEGGAGFDSTRIVVNEAAIRALGYASPEAAVGQPVRFQGGPATFRIGGVVRDFHFGPMHQAIAPLVVMPVQVRPLYRFFSFRLAPGNPRRTLAGLEQRWRTLFPDAPFEYAFMDQTLEQLYQTELQLEKAAYLATGLALLIVLLGVVGMVSLTVARRTREVGIRKVLGASVANVVLLFLREYFWVMILANLIAWPLAHLALSDWLAGYAYHTRIGWQPFVQVAALLAILTTGVVALQVIRTALMNPVNSIRSE